MKKPIFLQSSGLSVSLALCLLVSLCPGALYVFTEQGRLARSTDDGITWSWVSNPMPGQNCVDLTSGPDHYLYVLTRTGEIHRSLDQGSSWQSRGNISVPDASAIWVILGLTFVVTKSGDFYQRSNATGTWSLLGNIGASDCIDIAPHPTSGFLVFTRSGDVYQVNTSPFSKSLLSNIGSASVVGAATLTNAVVAVTEEGDVCRSTNGGTNWSWVGVVSQIGTAGIGTKGNNLYLTTDAGEVLRSANQGTNWVWRGNVSQIGIKGIASDSITVIGVEENPGIKVLEILSIYPNPSRGRFRVRLYSDADGDARIRIFNILGEMVGILWRGRVNSGLNIIELNKQGVGVHFLLIESSNITATSKLILE